MLEKMIHNTICVRLSFISRVCFPWKIYSTKTTSKWFDTILRGLILIRKLPFTHWDGNPDTFKAEDWLFTLQMPIQSFLSLRFCNVSQLFFFCFFLATPSPSRVINVRRRHGVDSRLNLGKNDVLSIALLLFVVL